MSSNYGKSFTTTETTKAADAEVVSDSIELSPRTKNHVLVVKADSSASGSVDVELEMSPDGNNWCPAVSKTVTGTSSSTSTGNIIGNESHVKLTPDTVDGVVETKNKHGRGLMNRNQDTDTAYNKNQPDETLRTDGADFMYHKIQTNKSFNYSQWIKSSEAPSATYNPVLFRHAGYDDFSNTKVPQLTATSSTPENGNALEGLTPTSSDPFHFPRGIVVQNESGFDLTSNVWSYGFWFKSNVNVGSGNVPDFGTTYSGGSYNRTLMASTIRAAGPGSGVTDFYGGFAIQVMQNLSNEPAGAKLSISMSEDGSKGHYDIVTMDVGATLFNGQWHHMLIVRETATPNPSTSTGFKVYIDGGNAESTTFYTYSNGAPNFANVSDKISICAGNAHTQTSSGNSLSYLHNARSIASSFLGIGQIDGCCFWKSDVTSFRQAIYNSGKPLAVNPGSPHAYLRFEDSSNLALNSVTGNTVSTVYNNPSTTTPISPTIRVQQASLTSSDSIYFLGRAAQNLCEPQIGNELSLRASSSTGNTIDYDLQGITNKNVFNLGGDNNFFDLSGEYSISFFGVIHSAGNFDAIIQIRTNSSTGHHVKIYQMGTKLVWSIGGNTTYRDIEFDVGSGPWATNLNTVYKHFVMVKRNDGEFPSGSNMDLYIDGVKQSAATAQPATNSIYYMSSFPSNLTVESVELFAGGGLFNAVGLNNTGTGGKTGARDVIDQVAFFNAALTDEEVTEIYPGNYIDLKKLYEPKVFNHTVTVQNVGGANYYFIDGVQTPTLTLREGSTYVFDTSDSSTSGHPLYFSTTANGTHGGGTQYTSGVVTNGTPGQSGSYITITVPSGAPTLYYYCINHSGMGGEISTPSLKSYFKCGDGINDNKVADGSVKTFDVIGGTAFFAPHTGTATGVAANSSTREYWVYANDPSGTSGNALYLTKQPVLKDNFTHAKAFSISCWVKIPTDHSGYGTIISNKSSSSYGDGLTIRYTNAQMLVVILAGGGSSGILMDGALNVNLHDNEWHHLVLTKSVPATGNVVTAKMYIDGILKDTDTYTGYRPDSQFAGSNGFTLLGDGLQNANQSNPSSTDPSKTKAELSNCSIHSEELDANAVAQMYSNGNVRNIKNLPSVDATKIVAWWQLNDSTNPQNDLIGDSHLKYHGPVINPNHIAIEGTPVHEIGGVYKEQPVNNVGNTGGLLSPNNTFNDYSSNNQTYNFWIYKPSNINGEITWLGDFSNIGGNELGYAFFSNSNYDLVFYSNDAGGTQNANYRYNGISLSGYEDQWIMVTFVTKPNITQSEFYINKSRVFTSHHDGQGGYLVPTSQSIEACGFFGARTWNGNIFPSAQNASDMTNADCKIDEYSAFNRALTQSEINELYDDRNPLTHSRNSDLYRYIKFGDGSNDTESSLTCQVDNTFVLDKSSSAIGSYLHTLSSSDPVYVAGSAGSLAPLLVDATGAALVNDTINGHGITMSITKSFNFTTKKWVSTTDQDAAICVSFNGFQEQAEYFALWKCSQVLGGTAINILDGNYHNVILSYRGKNDFSGNNVDPGDIVRFGPGDSSLAYNWTLSIDGLETTSINGNSGADYIGGLNTLSTATYGGATYNVGFAIQNRHLKFTIGNAEEVYKPHTQFSSGILDAGGSNKYAFQGFVDETSFHSDTWWVGQSESSITANDFNHEKPATIFGNTGGANNRGAGTEYPEGAPYPLRNPEKLVTSGNIADIQGTNQFINPNPQGPNNTYGGLEAFWRWGDTSADCSVTINDVKSAADGNNDRDIKAENLSTADVIALTSSDSTYIANAAAGSSSSSSSGGGTATNFPQVKLTNIVEGMKIFNIVSPLLKYLRVKWKGAGSVDLGQGKGEAIIFHTNRERRRKR